MHLKKDSFLAFPSLWNKYLIFKSINGLRNTTYIPENSLKTLYFLWKYNYLVLFLFVEMKPYMNLSTKARNENDNGMSCFLNSFWHMILFSAPLSALNGSKNVLTIALKSKKKVQFGKPTTPAAMVLCIWFDFSWCPPTGRACNSWKVKIYHSDSK